MVRSSLENARQALQWELTDNKRKQWCPRKNWMDDWTSSNKISRTLALPGKNLKQDGVNMWTNTYRMNEEPRNVYN